MHVALLLAWNLVYQAPLVAVIAAAMFGKTELLARFEGR